MTKNRSLDLDKLLYNYLSSPKIAIVLQTLNDSLRLNLF